MRGVITAVLVILAACAFELEHEIEIKGIGTPCENAFPTCDTEGYRCESADGEPVSACAVGCIGGRALECRADGAHCTNLAGSETIEVPIACFRVE